MLGDITVLRRLVGRVLRGFVLWSGDAAIGMIPLGAHYIAVQLGGGLNGAAPSGPFANPIPEVCILSVVVSGLSLVSMLKVVMRQGHAEAPNFTFVLGIFSMLCVAGGAEMYGLVAYAAVNSLRQPLLDVQAYAILAAALSVSLALELQKAVLRHGEP